MKFNKLNHNELGTVHQAAAEADVAPRTVFRWLSEGRLSRHSIDGWPYSVLAFNEVKALAATRKAKTAA